MCKEKSTLLEPTITDILVYQAKTMTQMAERKVSWSNLVLQRIEQTLEPGRV